MIQTSIQTQKTSIQNSDGNPAKTNLSPKAWQGRCRFGASHAAGPSSLRVRGKSRVKQPKTVPWGRSVDAKHT